LDCLFGLNESSKKAKFPRSNLQHRKTDFKFPFLEVPIYPNINQS
jgi:hypothetical protein